MAHSCNNCGCNKIDCGCKDSFLTTPPPCPTPENCPDPQPCSEVFDAHCIVYNGDPLTCSQTAVVTTGTPVDEALSNIIDYFCSTTGTDTVVEAGDNVTVTSNTVGNVTTYTVNAACAMTVKITKGTDDRIIATVTGGTAPYTYTWEMSDMWLSGSSNSVSMFILNSTSNPNVVQAALNPAVTTAFDFCASGSTGYIGLAKVIATDSNGCKAQDTFLLLSGQCA